MNMDNLSKKVMKFKKLQKLGAALVILIPKSWLKVLDWTQATNLILAFHPDEKKIILIENKENEEINQPADE